MIENEKEHNFSTLKRKNTKRTVWSDPIRFTINPPKTQLSKSKLQPRDCFGNKPHNKIFDKKHNRTFITNYSGYSISIVDLGKI